MGKHEDRAEALFLDGYNCAQAVFSVFAEDYGLDHATAMRLASSLGGGMGHTGQICGAALGMALAIGLLGGTDSAGTQEEKREQSARIKRMVETFREKFGATGCAELYELGNRGKCVPYVRYAVELVKQERMRRE